MDMSLDEFLQRLTAQNDLPAAARELIDQPEALQAFLKHYLEQQASMQAVKKSLDRRVYDLFTIFEISRTLVVYDVKQIAEQLVLTSIGQMRTMKLAFIFRQAKQFRVGSQKGYKDEQFRPVLAALDAGSAQDLTAPIRLDAPQTAAPESSARLVGALKPLNIAVALPLVIQGSCKGLFLLGKRPDNRGGAYSESEIELIATLANQAMVAVENAKLYESLERRIQELATFNEITRIVNSTSKLADVLELIKKSVTRSFGVSQYSLFLTDPTDDQRLAAADSEGIDAAGAMIRPEDAEFWNVFTSGHAAHVRGSAGAGGAGTSGRGAADPAGGLAGAYSVPLQAAGKTVGLMNIHALTSGGIVTPDLEKSFTVVASLLAPSILVGQIFESRRRSAIDPFGALCELIEHELARCNGVNLPLTIVQYRFGSPEHYFTVESACESKFGGSAILIRQNVDRMLSMHPMSAAAQVKSQLEEIKLELGQVEDTPQIRYLMSSSPEDGEFAETLLTNLKDITESLF